jgi:hypothetical protein
MIHLKAKVRSWLAAALVALYAACIFAPALGGSFHDSGRVAEELHVHAIDPQSDPTEHSHLGPADIFGEQLSSILWFMTIAAVPFVAQRAWLILRQTMRGLLPNALLRPPRFAS